MIISSSILWAGIVKRVKESLDVKFNVMWGLGGDSAACFLWVSQKCQLLCVHPLMVMACLVSGDPPPNVARTVTV